MKKAALDQVSVSHETHCRQINGKILGTPKIRIFPAITRDNKTDSIPGTSNDRGKTTRVTPARNHTVRDMMSQLLGDLPA